MKSRLVLFFALFFVSVSAFAQDYKKHKVAKGETITDIAKKHKVTPYDIYRLNPDSKNGIKENMVLLIPASVGVPVTQVKENPSEVVNTIHELQQGETLYSVSKKYNVTVDQLQKANPSVAVDDMPIGQKLIIPIKGNPVTAQITKAEKIDSKKGTEAYIYHKVESGETKYSIARDFDMTVQLIEELNPEVKDVLPLGYELKLINKNVVTPAPVAQTPVRNPNYMIFVVPPKETMYNLTKKTGLTEEQLIALNPELKDGLKEGMELRLPKAGVTLPGTPVKKTKADLTLNLKKSEQKELAILIPFNMYRVEQDTTRAQLLRGDKFLNLTLDFYSGALVAVDSARSLGLPLKVKIYDAKESSKSSEVGSLRSKLMGMDAVIGPFFPNNAETAASLLPGIPVISPLSKEYDKQYENLYQSVPSPDMAKKMLFDYLTAGNENVIAIIDPKKISSRDFIKDNYPSIRLVTVGEGITAAAVKAMLVKDKKNFVILETERSALAINSVKVLSDLLSDYQIQLAVPENGEVLESNEVKMEGLTALKLLYPSVTNDSETDGERLFVKMFREKNGYAPNPYATRGFDVTMDVILRLFQEQTFAETMDTVASEQAENRFSYKKHNGGYINTGIYLMQYGDEMVVTEAPARPAPQVQPVPQEQTNPMPQTQRP